MKILKLRKRDLNIHCDGERALATNKKKTTATRNNYRFAQYQGKIYELITVLQNNINGYASIVLGEQVGHIDPLGQRQMRKS